MDGFALAAHGERRAPSHRRRDSYGRAAAARDRVRRDAAHSRQAARCRRAPTRSFRSKTSTNVTATIFVRKPFESGACLTQRGDDMRAGVTALPCGRRIGGPELGVLATLGITSVAVYVRPRFGIFSTGDELVDPSPTPGLGQVRDSNRYAIAGALCGAGQPIPVQLPRAPDRFEELRAMLTLRRSKNRDGVILTGGSSVGARDLTPQVIGSLGRARRRRPRTAGQTRQADGASRAIGGKPVIGLPGNPASSLTILEAVARPIVVASTGEGPAARSNRRGDRRRAVRRSRRLDVVRSRAPAQRRRPARGRTAWPFARRTRPCWHVPPASPRSANRPLASRPESLSG